uniref:SCAN box domain-containing protein n=1 Tax=Mola mola TaxID=94237 RepID=A0A3Q3WUY4_MOLML
MFEPEPLNSSNTPAVILRSQQMFGEPHIHPNENLREFYNRTKEQVGEILILEQFCHILSSELRVWVMERDPHSTREETQILEIFLEDQQVSKSYQLEAPAKAIAAQGKPLGPTLTGNGSDLLPAMRTKLWLR